MSTLIPGRLPHRTRVLHQRVIPGRSLLECVFCAAGSRGTRLILMRRPFRVPRCVGLFPSFFFSAAGCFRVRLVCPGGDTRGRKEREARKGLILRPVRQRVDKLVHSPDRQLRFSRAVRERVWEIKKELSRLLSERVPLGRIRVSRHRFLWSPDAPRREYRPPAASARPLRAPEPPFFY